MNYPFQLPRVYEYAELCHRSQVRKYTGEPYICHPLEVAGLVGIYLPGDRYAAAMAILHDVVEDTDGTLDDVRSLFGDTVELGVYFLTDDKPEGMNRATRNVLYNEKLAKAKDSGLGEKVHTVKCCDIISNGRSVATHDPKFALTWCDEKFETLKYLTQAIPSAWMEAYRVLTESKGRAEQWFLDQKLAKVDVFNG